jgi:hypothetical protein
MKPKKKAQVRKMAKSKPSSKRDSSFEAMAASAQKSFNKQKKRIIATAQEIAEFFDDNDIHHADGYLAARWFCFCIEQQQPIAQVTGDLLVDLMEAKNG